MNDTPRTNQEVNGKPCTRFAVLAGDPLRDALVPAEFARELERELAATASRLRVALAALRELHDEQNGAPLERRRVQWQAAMMLAVGVLRDNNA